MAGRMEGKVALISGGGHPEGQGASHAEVIAREGGKVVISDIQDDLGEATAAALAAKGLDVVYTHLDVTDADQWDAAIRLAEERFGRLDVLVNNAGLESRPSIIDCSDAEWNLQIGVHQTGTFLGMRQAVPALKRAGRGAIVNLTSIYGIDGANGFIAYIAAKAAVIGMTKSAAHTLADDNIRVNAIAPGLIRTPMLTEGGTRDLAVLQPLLERKFPLKWVADPIDITHGVVYLASEESRYVTGIVLPIDGGFSAG